MSLQDFIGRGWQEHGDDAEGVWSRLPEAFGLIESPGDALQVAALGLHVAGEHLGRWDEGLSLLGRLRARTPAGEDENASRALARQEATLLHCAGREAERDAKLAEGRDPAHPPGSSEARVFAIAASALAGQRRAEEAVASFRRAMEAASYGPGAEDPAARALAITSNNLACELEEKRDRSAGDDALLREAAQAARRFWEIAGDWRNVKIAEYRLSRTHLELGEPAAAAEHARTALRACDENDGGALDRFFPHEALALALHAGGDAAGARAERDAAAACLEGIEDEGDRSWCAGELAKLDERLGSP